MSEDRQFLSQILVRSPLRGEEGRGLLRRLLQSQADGAAHGHLAAGMALFSAADMAPELEKRLLYDQIFFCLMRALEDFAMLCLMGWDEARHPLDIYLNLDRPELRAFFSRARKGLGDEVMFKLMGIAPWPSLKRLPAFKDTDFSSDESALEWAAGDARETLMRFGKLYHSIPEDADTEIGPWQIAYAKAPIGLKLLLSAEHGDEMLIGSEQADPATNAPATAFSAPVKVDSHFAEKVLHELEAVCFELRRLALRRLQMMDDPTAGARGCKADWQEHLKKLAARRGEAAAAAGAAPADSPPAGPAEAAVAEEHHADPRHDAPGKKIMEVGGLRIIHSESEKKK